ncbi:MAG: IS110 family transposase [Deltaproteobacteria bacterium]|nr:IS110 family transposase [Deltaproteobacteria bacterium]
MIYVGMDVSSKSFVVHAIDERKKVVFEGEIAPTREGIRELISKLGAQPKLVVFEAGNQMKWIAETLKKQPKVEVHVVHPNEVKWIAESGGKKTDKVDAKKLAHLARGDMLPRKVHIVEGRTREMRELVSARVQLMNKRVSMINTLRGYIKQEGIRLGEKFFGQEDWQEQLEKKKVSAPLKAIIKAFRSSIEALCDSEHEIAERLTKIKDERTELLETIPAIGKLSSRTLVSAIDDAKRFDNRKAVANYGALTPTVYQSGDSVQMGRINRDGRHEVRRVMLQCAHTVARMSSPASKPLRTFFERIEKKRGKKKAIVAVARKLLTIAYGVLKSGEPFDPKKLEPSPEPSKKTTPAARKYVLKAA